MAKPIYLVAAIVLVLTAFFAGNAVPSFSESREKSAMIRLASSRLPLIDFSMCRSLLVEEVPSCLDGQLAGYAATHADASACAEIQDGSLRATCLTRVNMVSNFGGDSSAFCRGLSDDPLCADLAAVLFARLQNKREACFAVLSEELKKVCINLFAGGSLAAAPSPAVIGENGLPIKQYGMICPAGDETCPAKQQAFNAAVLGQSEEGCASLGVFAEQCLDEVALYKAYVTKNDRLCETRFTSKECDLQLAIARGLDGRPDLCASLSDPVHAQTCRVEVESSGGQSRFDYLQ